MFFVYLLSITILTGADGCSRCSEQIAWVVIVVPTPANHHGLTNPKPKIRILQVGESKMNFWPKVSMNSSA